MTWEYAFALLAGLGLVELLAFVAVYATRVPWRGANRTMGIAIMSLIGILALMFGLIFVARLLGGLGAAVWSISLGCFDLIILRWLILLVRAQRHTPTPKEGIMTTNYPTTLGVNTVPVNVDARNRAVRTFFQNLGVDLLVALLPLLYDAVSGWNGAFDKTYWTIVIVSLAKTGTLTLVSYLARKVSAPVGAQGPALPASDR